MIILVSRGCPIRLQTSPFVVPTRTSAPAERRDRPIASPSPLPTHRTEIRGQNRVAYRRTWRASASNEGEKTPLRLNEPDHVERGGAEYEYSKSATLQTGRPRPLRAATRARTDRNGRREVAGQARPDRGGHRLGRSHRGGTRHPQLNTRYGRNRRCRTRRREFSIRHGRRHRGRTRRPVRRREFSTRHSRSR